MLSRGFIIFLRYICLIRGVIGTKRQSAALEAQQVRMIALGSIKRNALFGFSVLFAEHPHARYGLR